MRQEWIEDVELEALTIMRAAANACGTPLSGDETITLYAMALARRQGLEVRQTKALNGSIDKRMSALLRRIRASMRFVWR